MYFVKFCNEHDPFSKIDVCEVHIHPYNFSSTEEKLYVYFPSSKLKEIIKLCEISKFIVDVEFEVKHFYFNSLQSAVVRLSESMLNKLLPKQSYPAAKQLSAIVKGDNALVEDNQVYCYQNNYHGSSVLDVYIHVGLSKHSLSYTA